MIERRCVIANLLDDNSTQVKQISCFWQFFDEKDYSSN
jgi:hypothetical protein